MRQGQFKNRSRNRGRRPSSPLSRVYESNGPDVKVRGTAQHVAEKYLQLARDAMSSGDPVMGESYYQHAEHYQRIVAAAQTYQQQQQGYQPNQQRRHDGDEDGFEDGDEPMGAESQVQPVFAEQPEAQPDAEFEPPSAPVPPPVPHEEAGERKRNWDGHQPDFLKRSASGSNGTGRPRRERSGRGRGGQSQSAEAAAPAASGDTPEPTSRETPEQVG